MFDLKSRINYQKCFCLYGYMFTGRGKYYRRASDGTESILSPLVRIKRRQKQL